MPLRDQPYLPLYVQDFMTDEKLSECSASSTGVYIRIMCLMHKTETYGKILLKQKHKQTDNQIKNFASAIAKNLPYTEEEVYASLVELVEEKVLYIEGDFLIQKRMVKDNEISEKRAIAGKNGGIKSQLKVKSFAPDFALAKSEANSEYEIEYENENEIRKESTRENQKVAPIYAHDSEEFKKAFDEWIQYRKQKKQSLTKITMRKQSSFLSEYPNETAIKILNQSMQNGWTGLFPLKPQSNGNKPTFTEDSAKPGSIRSAI